MVADGGGKEESGTKSGFFFSSMSEMKLIQEIICCRFNQNGFFFQFFTKMNKKNKTQRLIWDEPKIFVSLLGYHILCFSLP